MSRISEIIGYSGTNAVGVVDFNATGEAAMSVTIGGVVFQEADTADAPNGVWTNGASAANSATSLAAAINGDTRSQALPISAKVSDVGDSVVVMADNPGTAGNYAVSTTSASAATVENLHEGENTRQKRAFVKMYTVTAQDVLADEINIPLPFTPTHWGLAQVLSATGLILATQPTGLLTLQTSPGVHLRYNFAGATDPSAGQVLTVFGME